MQITNIQVKKNDRSFPNKVKGYATVTFDDCFVIKNIKIIKSPKTDKLIVAMPSRRLKNGGFKDVCHPITTELREEITKAIVEKLQ